MDLNQFRVTNKYMDNNGIKSEGIYIKLHARQNIIYKSKLIGIVHITEKTYTSDNSLLISIGTFYFCVDININNNLRNLSHSYQHMVELNDMKKININEFKKGDTFSETEITDIAFKICNYLYFKRLLPLDRYKKFSLLINNLRRDPTSYFNIIPLDIINTILEKDLY